MSTGGEGRGVILTLRQIGGKKVKNFDWREGKEEFSWPVASVFQEDLKGQFVAGLWGPHMGQRFKRQWTLEVVAVVGPQGEPGVSSSAAPIPHPRNLLTLFPFLCPPRHRSGCVYRPRLGRHAGVDHRLSSTLRVR